MRELWALAFKEFESLSAMSAADRDARMRVLRAEQPELAKLLDQLLNQPAISLQPIPWSADMTADTTATGRRLGAYTLIREIGRGGTGSVWLGERADGLYRGQVAIKLLSAPVLHDTSARQRFAREGELLARLSHPNIARLLDAGTSDEGARCRVWCHCLTALGWQVRSFESGVHGLHPRCRGWHQRRGRFASPVRR